MAELHVCTCGYTDETASFDAGRTIGGCAAVPYRDVCRFEQALADPTQAQVDAVVAVLRTLGDEPTLSTWDDVAREALAAAALVVLGRPPCTSCGRPLGTGTLLDYSPQPPAPGGWQTPMATLLEWQDIRPRQGPKGIERGLWEEFAVRYRCPYCAEEDGPDA